jgi:two-component system LytT family response regulator
MNPRAAPLRRLRVLVVDDEAPARRGLLLRLADDPQIEVIGEADGGRAAIHAIIAQRPDLVLLDVQMPAIDGFAVLRALPAALLPQVVFVTAHDRYAVKAFEVHALDYLLKPIDRERLHEALARAKAVLRAPVDSAHCAHLLALLADASGRDDLTLDEALAEQPGRLRQATHLTVHESGRTLRLPFDDIDWIEAAGDYMCVHTATRTFVLRSTMAGLLRRLDARRFQRVHRSTVVGVRHVREILTHPNGEAILVMSGGHRLKVSRGYRAVLEGLRR